MKTDKTSLWKLYETGKNYNNKLSPAFYKTIDRNEQFYAGDQWAGVQAGNLDTPVFNIFKRVINYFIAAIMSQQTKIQFVPELVGDEAGDELQQKMKDAAELISAYSDTLWENLKMNTVMRERLLDAALSGDACQYMFWNPLIETMQDVKGDIDSEGIDNVNVFFGNPNDKRINYNGMPIQPYIIISFRQLVSKLKEEAKLYGVPSDEIESISSDEDNLEQSGDRGKIELEGDENTGKTIALLKLWYDEKTKTIKACKSTKFVDIRPEWHTKLTIYPIAWMNWDSRKNSYHGQAVGTGLIPNQIFINKAFAMVMLWIRTMAFPKVIYDKTRIASWSNQIGAAIGLENVQPGENVSNAAAYMNPSQISETVIKVIDLAIQYTKDMLGASDGALGDINPEQASGISIMATQKQASIPLENIKANLYQFVEDIGYIWFDIMANYYGKRKITANIMVEKIDPVTGNKTKVTQKVVREFDFSMLKNMKMRIKVDVGPSSYWSELAAVQTLDNLRKEGVLTVVQYLDRLPNGYIPEKEALIEELKATQEQQVNKDSEYEMMAQIIEQFVPDELKPQAMQMIQGGGMNGQM